MSDETHQPEPPQPPGKARNLPRAEVLARYLEANRGSFTDEALVASAAAAGYTPDEIAEAHARLQAQDAAAPVKATARRIVIGAYLVVYALLSAGMLANNFGGGAVILAVSLGIPFLISLAIVRGRGRLKPGTELALGGLLVLPLVMLVIVGGLCVATGLPFHPLTI
jgi:hypothetical protein